MMVSIDDYAMAHLKLMLDDVFGEDNHLGTIAVRRSKNGKSAKKGVATGHEYVLVYRKSVQGKIFPLPDLSEYPKEDAYGRYRIDGLFRKKGDASLRTDRPNLFYPLYACLNTGSVSVEPKGGSVQIFPRDSRGTERRWIWSKETAAARSHCLYSSPNGVVYVKNYQSGQGAGKISSWWDNPAYYTERGTVELKAVFGEKIFETPKPIAFIKQLLSIAGSKQARILDFFAGSGTTAIAAHQLNQADGGDRSVVLMESNTKVPPSSKAFQQGFQTISDITLARLLGSGLEPHRVDDWQL
jgi:adenine-specific DNA-methyltransferase